MQCTMTSPVLLMLAIFVGSTSMMSADASASTLYDLDFGTPPHTVGQLPTTGSGPAPRATVSSINFGTPTVVATLGAMMDQPCEFDSFDNQGDQIQLDLIDLAGSDSYTLSCDILVGNLVGSGDFAILLDTPQIRTIRFAATGDVNVYVPAIFNGSVSTFTMGSIIHLDVVVDLLGNAWEIYLDQGLVHSGSFGGATEVRDIRFSTPVVPNPAGSNVGLDNVVITDVLAPIAVDPGTWGAIKNLYR